MLKTLGRQPLSVKPEAATNTGRTRLVQLSMASDALLRRPTLTWTQTLHRIRLKEASPAKGGTTVNLEMKPEKHGVSQRVCEMLGNPPPTLPRCLWDV